MLHAPLFPEKPENAAEVKLADQSKDTVAFRADNAHVHERERRQVALVVQNEELRKTQMQCDSILAQFVELYDFAPVGYCTVCESGLIAQANHCAAALLGQSRQALEGLPFIRFIYSADQETFARYRAHVLESGGTTTSELRMRSSDGIVFWAKLSATAAFPPDGAKNLRIVLNDITERKNAETATAMMQEQLRLFIKYAPAALAMFDRDMRYISVSDRWRTDYGLGDRDLHGVSHYDVFPHVGENWKEIHRRGLAGEVLESEGEPISLPDGTTQWIRWALLPWHASGQSIGGIVILSDDVTERKRIEQELATLRANLTQISTWQVAHQTATALAHELNQPLACIAALSAAANRLHASYQGTLREAADLSNVLNHIESESERAGGTIRNLLESLHRPQSSVDRCSILQILESAVRAAGTSEQVQIEVPDNLPQVSINRLLVEKVLLNLISNGIEAMRKASKVDGKVSIQAELSIDACYLCLSVRDEGPGVSLEMESQMFYPFVTSKEHGLGIGLSVSRAIIEAHGGKLWCEPNYGQATTFRFTLPAVR